jgi:hypothetical protein
MAFPPGEFLWSKQTTQFEVYKYEDALAYPTGVDTDGTVLAWVFGFQKTCGKDLNSFAFARVHLATATAKLVACIAKKDVVPARGTPRTAPSPFRFRKPFLLRFGAPFGCKVQ